MVIPGAQGIARWKLEALAGARMVLYVQKRATLERNRVKRQYDFTVRDTWAFNGASEER